MFFKITTQSKYTNVVYCLIFKIRKFQTDILFRLAMRKHEKKCLIISMIQVTWST